MTRVQLYSRNVESGKLLARALLAIACLVPAVATAAATVTWKEKFFNPKPLDDDVILPLPCGGAMAFRRVDIESTGPLADQRVDLGSSVFSA